MRIKKIEITGFKSFCDRMVVHINDPITAVVGPNGCGKSNIVDAIRWAMGEQSAKHLRGKSMDDVIFNGSESRGPAAYAEVTLTFENAGLDPASRQSELELELSADDDLEEAENALAAADSVAEWWAVAEPGTGAGTGTGTGADEETRPVVAGDEVETPIDYRQYGEVSVTRRLYRDGTSEYEIN